MRIIDYSRDVPLEEITLLLDEVELTQMIGYLEHLLKEPQDHVHLNSADFGTEITVARFDNPNPELFDEETRKYL